MMESNVSSLKLMSLPRITTLVSSVIVALSSGTNYVSLRLFSIHDTLTNPYKDILRYDLSNTRGYSRSNNRSS